MNARFHVVTVLHPSGERLPILLDAERQPVIWINVYLIQRLRLRLSVNSLVKTLRVLGYLWVWAYQEGFPLEARLRSGQGLTQEEIFGRLSMATAQLPDDRESPQTRGLTCHDRIPVERCRAMCRVAS